PSGPTAIGPPRGGRAAPTGEPRSVRSGRPRAGRGGIVLPKWSRHFSGDLLRKWTRHYSMKPRPLAVGPEELRAIRRAFSWYSSWPRPLESEIRGASAERSGEASVR